MRVRDVLMSCLGFPAAAPLWAATITVPDDATSIQAGLNLAQAGDTVQVRERVAP